MSRIIVVPEAADAFELAHTIQEQMMKKVYEAENSVEAHMIADMLERGGIEAQVKGDHDPLMPASVWILDDNKYQTALEIIASVPPDEGRQKEERTRQNTGRLQFLNGFLLALTVAVVVFIYLMRSGTIAYTKNHYELDTDRDGKVDTWYENLGGTFRLTKEDMNYDGEPDTWFHYRDNRLENTLTDSNFDGKLDTRYEYENGHRKVTVSSDEDFDGKMDRWDFYSNGSHLRYAKDNDRDGKEDEWGYYKDSQIDEVKWSFKNDGVIDKVTTYKNDRKTSEKYDRDRDGTFDETIYYDEFERVVKVER